MGTPTGHLLKDIELALSRAADGMVVFAAEPSPDVFVTDLFFDEGGVGVEPEEYWGVERSTAQQLLALNDAIREATEDALNAACRRVQIALGVTAGDLAGMHFSGHETHAQVSMAMCGYAIAEMREKLEAEGFDAAGLPKANRLLELPMQLTLNVFSEGDVVDKTTVEMKPSDVEAVVDHAVHLIELHRAGHDETFDEVVGELEVTLVAAGVLEDDDIPFSSESPAGGYEEDSIERFERLRQEAKFSPSA